MFIRYTKFRLAYFIFSVILIAASIYSLFAFGLKPGIDFTGGSILEAEYKESRPSNQEIRDKLSGLDLGSFYIQPTQDQSVILRMKDISEETHREILSRLGINEGLVEEKSFDSIGPVIGKELKGKMEWVIFLALVSMMIYIAFAFRRVQRPLKSWQYSISTLFTLFHDILIPLGIFAVLSKLYGVEVTIPIITALLTVLGYSINNTVVVFDRIRENLFLGGPSFEEVVDKSLNQTFSRQVNTSLTTLFVVFSIFFFGGVTLKYFVLALILGIISGTYSSFFISGPLLVAWLKIKERKQKA